MSLRYNKSERKLKEKIMAKKITADTLISECLELNPNAAEILLATGMHCIGCAMAHGEAVAVHGEDLESLLSKLNAGVE